MNEKKKEEEERNVSEVLQEFLKMFDRFNSESFAICLERSFIKNFKGMSLVFTLFFL